LHIKTYNRTLFFGNTLKYGRHSDYWNQPLNMRIRVWYLDCFEAGLCYYLVIHIEKLLRPFWLFYFLLWPVYWRRIHPTGIRVCEWEVTEDCVIKVVIMPVQTWNWDRKGSGHQMQ
jgi:hypothetical protein